MGVFGQVIFVRSVDWAASRFGETGVFTCIISEFAKLQDYSMISGLSPEYCVRILALDGGALVFGMRI